MPDIGSANTASISYQLIFGCPVIAYQNNNGFTKETVDISYNGGTTQTGLSPTSTYNILSASLSILPGMTNSIYTGNVGDTFVQELTIRNGGLGCTTTAFLVLDNAGGSVSFSDPDIGVIRNDTLFFSALEMPGGDSQWCNGEDLTFKYTVKIKNCKNLNRAVQAGWGCGGSSCQVSTVGPATNVKLKTIVFDVGNYTSATGLDTLEHIWEIKNSLGVVIGSVNNFNNVHLVTSDFYSGNSPICAAYPTFRDVQGTLSVPILPGESVFVDVYSRPANSSCLTSCPSGLGYPTLSNQLDYQNQCGQGAYQEPLHRYMANYGAFFNTVPTFPTDVEGGATENLDIGYSIFYTGNPGGNASYYIAIPLSGSGLSPAVSSVTLGVYTMPLTVVNDTIFIEAPLGVSIVGNLRIPMNVSCGVGGIKTLSYFHLSKYDKFCQAKPFKTGCISQFRYAAFL